jgi:hypothetical protein
MANEKFEFIFSEEPTKRYLIDEPVNYSEVDFVLEQKENRMGRDESLNGGENRFRFVDYRNHYVDKLFYYYHTYFFEADILLIITTENGQEYVSELHFVDIETDEITYLECRTITRSTQQIIKSRRETPVDMFSDLDIDGNFIGALTPSNMLLQAKPTQQVSIWEQSSPTTVDIVSFFLTQCFNISQSIKEAGIEDTLMPFAISGTNENIGEFKILNAQTNLKNVNLEIKDVDIILRLSASVYARIFVYKGETIETANPFLVYSSFYENDRYLEIKGNFNLSIGDINRGESVWMVLVVQQKVMFDASIEINKITTIATAESVSYNSIVPTFRLIDVMRQVVKSISGQSVLSSRYDFAGQFYDNVLFNGNLMRSETTKPFYVSLKDIEDFIWGEHKGDSEISEDGSVFFGIERDYYTDIECGFFDNVQFEEMNKNTNQKYAINEFKYKYGKYQSLKENTEPNSDSTIHGESIWTFFNKRAPSKLEINIEVVRDAMLIDAQQKLATKITKDTATQDDDTIFVLDVLPTVGNRQFTETTNLKHVSNGSTLLLRSNGEVNFITLGIRAFTTFIIELANVNAGTYIVESVNSSEIVLSGGSFNSINDGVKLTKYTYEIKQATIPLTNRTDEGFTAISDLLSPDKYSNLRYSVKRNILNYWNSTLSTANLAHKTKEIKNTFYKNNGKCNTTYAGLNVIEKDNFIPSDPILSPFVYENLTYVNVDFDDFKEVCENIKKDRGYIRGINKNMRVIKVYPTKITYVNAEKRLVINGEEKFEKAYLTISNEGGVILVNNETRLIRLRWEFDEYSQEILLFDKERFRLYNGVIWDKVSVNGANATTKEELFSWLKLLE